MKLKVVWLEEVKKKKDASFSSTVWYSTLDHTEQDCTKRLIAIVFSQMLGEAAYYIHFANEEGNRLEMNESGLKFALSGLQGQCIDADLTASFCGYQGHSVSQGSWGYT